MPEGKEREETAQERRERVFRAANHVWRQMSDPERLFVLERLRVRKPNEALERAKRHGGLAALKLGERRLRFIMFYPRTEHRRGIYREVRETRQHEGRQRDQYVTRYERRLRGRGVR